MLSKLFLQKIKEKTSLLILALLLVYSPSCSKNKVKKAEIFDTQNNLTRNQIKKALVRNSNNKTQKIVVDNQESEPSIPDSAPLVIASPPPIVNSNKIISFSSTEQVPLKDVLTELGRVAKIDIDIANNVTGGVLINARNRPFTEVVERIAVLGNLRYKYDNGVLYFERDTPFIKNYSVDYLSDGSNMWSDVQLNISAIITSDSNNNNHNNNLANNQQNNNSSNNSANQNNNSSNNSNNNNNSSDPNQSQNNNNNQALQPTRNTRNSSSSSFTINKTAGIITAFATQKQHNEIKKYLADVERNASMQVLIEAKVVEVKLTDTFKTGINWNWVDSTKNGSLISIGANNGYTKSSALDLKIGEAPGVKKILFGGNINASISALQQFGVARTLSSPRIHAVNNQKATLNFTEKKVYFKLDSTQSTISTSTNPTNVRTLNSTKQEENVGIELTIIPSISPNSKQITLNIKPKITTSNETVLDPASPVNSDGEIIAENRVPIVKTREISTIAKVESGSVIVIGGLMQEDAENIDSGIPFLGKIPILGFLFKSISKDSKITETVIFIKATIVDNSTKIDEIDYDLQEKFDTNKRKFF